MEEIMTVKTVDGQSFTFTGEIVKSVKSYFGTENKPPIGWVSTSGGAVNFNHAISVQFSKG